MEAGWMFNRGAMALQAALPRLPHVRFEPGIVGSDLDVYVCPLCLEGVGRADAGMLTLEHAPPQSVGGNVVTLTCYPCNSSAGPIQAHAHRRLLWEQFNEGMPGSRRPVRVSVDDISVTADIVFAEDSYNIVVDPSRSNPAHHADLVERLGRGDQHFEVTGSTGFVPEKAAASDLRDAYLLAFALLGYRYVMWRDLQPIRDMISAGGSDTRLMKLTALLDPQFEGILTLSSPVECVCVVRPGGRCIFLPWPNQSAELMSWLASGTPMTEFPHGRAHPIPRRMPFLLDLPPS